MSLDNLLYLPITSYQAILGTRQSITIRGQASSRETFNPALDQVQMAMRIRHQLKSNDADDFGLLSTDEINSAVDQFTRAVAMVVVPIALISLLVAGVVIMNIMLVSVSERTFEVGIRKTLGARRQDILYQFLIESFLLAGLGGTTGLGVASLICWIVDSNTSMTMTIPLAYALLSLGLSGGVGILFGIYPALQAAQLDPIVALRSER